MGFNPLTALSEQLQKLITEHGSAAILRDHLSLFKDQVASLEKKAAALEQKVALLEAENAELKTKSYDLAKDNQELRDKIQRFEQPTHDDLLDSHQTAILVILSQKQGSLQTKPIASAIGIDSQLTKFHLDELKRKKLIKHSVGLQGANRGNDVWSLAHEGRRYLMTHKLIS